MTSILDQYEEATSPFSRCSPNVNDDDMLERTSDYSQLGWKMDANRGAEESCSLIMKPLSVPLATNHKLQRMVAAKDTIVYLTTKNSLFWLDRKRTHKAEEIDAVKWMGGGTCKIRNVFLDRTTGCHLLISMVNVSKNTPLVANVASSSSSLSSSPLCVGTVAAQASASSASELFYLNSRYNGYKPKAITKMKGNEVTAVGWNRMHVSPHCSSFTLLGTSKGLIFEVEINLESEKLFQSGAESYCRQVFDVGKSNACPAITGIEFHQLVNASENYFILVTTTNRLYQFVGKTNGNVEEKPFLSQIFNNYLNVPEEGYIEIANKGRSSMLHVYYSSNRSDEDDDDDGHGSRQTSSNCGRAFPKFFAWQVDGAGIFFGKLNLYLEEGSVGGGGGGGGSVCVQKRLLKYDSQLTEAICVALTEFHILLLYADRIVAISNVNKQTAFVCYNDEMYGKYVDISQDGDNNVWILCEKGICLATFTQEDRLVWKIYAEMNEFSLAKKYCRGEANALRDVQKKEAEYCFVGGLYEKSAALYSELDCVSFEEIALKFLLVEQMDALKLYLHRMLNKLKAVESTHVTVVVFWLFEIYERQLAGMKHDDSKADEYRLLEEEMRTFLSYPSVMSCLKTNKEVIYKVLNSHGDMTNLVALATDGKDYENIIKHYLEEGQIHSALSIFQEESVSSIRKYLTKSFLTEFATLAPKETVDLLIKLGRNVEPSSFLSSLIIPSDNSNQAFEVIRYLEYCVHSLHSRDESVHNYLITLYARHKPDRLMSYLETQGQDASMVNYDIRYALKLCQEHGLKKACVQLSSLLGLWESAVDLALTVSLDLAKQVAIQPCNQNPELCKRLWLKIAQHVVNESNDIEKAMKFLQQCDTIKIEDILPFFSDFVTIDLFKDAICSTLQEYNEHIERLKEEIDEAISSADSIRSNINSFRHKYAIIHSSDLCCSCNIQLLLRPFYVFPCSHYFHKDCLMAEVKQYLDEESCNKLQRLQHEMIANRYVPACASLDDDYPIQQHAKQVSAASNMDALLANECVFCGDLMISCMDKPFVDHEEFDKICSDWL